MRPKNFLRFLACGSIVVCMATAAMADCGCGGMSKRSYNSLSGPPCFSPPGCAVAPGCCECQPSACDNAWAGYCQHKAKWQAYFATVGTGGPCYGYPRRPCYGTPTPALRENNAESDRSPAPTASPEPAKPKPLPPAPTPEKTTRTKVLYPWMR